MLNDVNFQLSALLTNINDVIFDRYFMDTITSALMKIEIY